MLAEEHGVELNLVDWSGSMIRMAIPYARTAVTVVAPDASELSPAIRAEGARLASRSDCCSGRCSLPEALAKTACWYGVHPIAGTD
jgi:hypothetical protein